jgi:hypothetical protein
VCEGDCVCAAGLAVRVRVCVCVRACERVSARRKDDDSVGTDRRQVQDRRRILASASTSTRARQPGSTAYLICTCAPTAQTNRTHKFPPLTCAHNAQRGRTDKFGFDV